MKNLGKFSVAFLAGATVGAVIALLYAPQKGSETMKQISDFASELAEAVKGKESK